MKIASVVMVAIIVCVLTGWIGFACGYAAGYNHATEKYEPQLRQAWEAVAGQKHDMSLKRAEVLLLPITND